MTTRLEYIADQQRAATARLSAATRNKNWVDARAAANRLMELDSEYLKEQRREPPKTNVVGRRAAKG